MRVCGFHGLVACVGPSDTTEARSRSPARDRRSIVGANRVPTPIGAPFAVGHNAAGTLVPPPLRHKSGLTMRFRALATAALTVAALGTSVQPASAVDLTGCAITQVNYGMASCLYVAVSNRGTLTLRIIDGLGAAEAYCSSGGGAYRESSGTSNYAQVPGDFCTVYVYVDSTTGESVAHGGSVIL